MNASRYRLLPDGGRMPRLLYGTAWKQAQTKHWVQTALAHGFDGIDTACQPKHYDEAGVGAGIAAADRPRAELYLQTKFTPLSGQDPARVPYDAGAGIAQQIAQSFAVSQRNLRSDTVDALLLHSPLRDPREMRLAWQALEALTDGGQVGLIGISNCYDADLLQRLHAQARVKPAIVQNRFHAATGYDRPIRAFCRSNGIVYQSFWTLSANARLLGDMTLLGLAAAYARTPAQILFRYLLQRDVVPLTGTTSLTHLRESLAVFDFELDAADCSAIDALL